MTAPLSSCAGYVLLYLYWCYNPLSPKAPRSLTKIGYHQWWGLIIMLWIPLSQVLDTKSFYDNSREIKFMGSTQGASSQNFSIPLYTREFIYHTWLVLDFFLRQIFTYRIFFPESPGPLAPSEVKWLAPLIELWKVTFRSCNFRLFTVPYFSVKSLRLYTLP